MGPGVPDPNLDPSAVTATVLRPESALTSHCEAKRWAVAALSAEEAHPQFAEFGRRSVVAVGSEGLVDRVHHLAGPAGPLGGDPNQRPLAAGEVFVAINVAVPLVAILAVLISPSRHGAAPAKDGCSRTPLALQNRHRPRGAATRSHRLRPCPVARPA
jgi:hypothetical protein